ncbi:hypothetical protein [Massilia sp. CCM 8734]|uniref:hypothetical protein n=1 Tax=Massilia sp. CCM 8734 TaxID=2609283 RepID=UPI001421004F|nr:hypothetical protein [Massilia sp. CCM 8734]NHZ94629.1 hypothetical protein [Massilia sp. CCM 8734]
MSTIFRGELQLLRWSDTSTGGATVTFQLADVADLDAFKDLTLAKKGMAGQRIAAIMAQVTDDVEQPPEEKQRPGMLCIMACNFCAAPDFIDWAIGVTGNADDAKAFVLSTCGIDSRKKLDTDKAAAMRFHSLIREPYMKYKGATA